MTAPFQRQDSLTDQLIDVEKKAVEMGCYDASDWIKARLHSVYGPRPDANTASMEEFRRRIVEAVKAERGRLNDDALTWAYDCGIDKAIKAIEGVKT